jgi:hypothetical protein
VAVVQPPIQTVIVLPAQRGRRGRRRVELGFRLREWRIRNTPAHPSSPPPGRAETKRGPATSMFLGLQKTAVQLMVGCAAGAMQATVPLQCGDTGSLTHCRRRTPATLTIVGAHCSTLIETAVIYIEHGRVYVEARHVHRFVGDRSVRT